ncbi:MAG: hypothetical protein Q9168_002967 [Polycauliona sp. 1 TL-2023]
MLAPLFKKLSILSAWIPSLRSKITRPNRSDRDASKGLKVSGPIQDHDVERNALRTGGLPTSSWQTPKAWREAEGRRAWDDYHTDGDDRTSTMKSESDITLQELQRIESDDVTGEKRNGGGGQGLKDFLADELHRDEKGQDGR